MVWCLFFCTPRLRPPLRSGLTWSYRGLVPPGLLKVRLRRDVYILSLFLVIFYFSLRRQWQCLFLLYVLGDRLTTADEDATIHSFTINIASSFLNIQIIFIASYLKLFRIIFIKKCDWNTHCSVVISRYISSFIHIDGIVVVVFWIFFRSVFFEKNQIFVAFFIIQIGKPTHTLHPDKFISFLINSKSCCIQRVILRYAKFSISTMNACAKPHLFVLYQLKNFFV